MGSYAYIPFTGVGVSGRMGVPEQNFSSSSCAFFSSSTTGDLRTATRAAHVGGGSISFSHLLSELCRQSKTDPLIASRSDGWSRSPNPIIFHLLLTSHSSFNTSQSALMSKAVPEEVYKQRLTAFLIQYRDLHASTVCIPAIFSCERGRRGWYVYKIFTNW